MKPVPSYATNRDVDTRSNAEFFNELATVREKSLAAQLHFMRNKKNRDRAIFIPNNTLSRLLAG